MRGNANCSEMVMTLQTIVLYLTQLALSLERYIQRLDCLLGNLSWFIKGVALTYVVYFDFHPRSK